MRKSIYVLIICFLATICVACDSPTSLSEPNTADVTSNDSDGEEIVVQLAELNESLHKENTMPTRSTSDGIKVGLADAKGAYDGLCAGGILGMLAGAILYSVLAYICLFLESLTNEAPSKTQLKEMIYSVEYNPVAYDKALAESSMLNLNLPSEFSDIKGMAIKHNAVLHMCLNEKDIIVKKLPTSGIPFLSTGEFDRMYDDIIESDGKILWGPINYNLAETGNAKLEKEILNLYYEACINDCHCEEDIQKIASGYIDVIDRSSLPNNAKERIYAYIVTSAYSFCYWNNNVGYLDRDKLN